jgi:hypothetical protein
MRAISLGWGVQSWALVAMSVLGELPPVDVAIHADTTFERAETYEFAQRLTPWLEERGVRVVTVNDKCTQQIAEPKRGVFIPAFTKSAVARRDRKRGKLHRQCAQRWKIAPIRRWLQANRDGQQVEQWLGITVDEIKRVEPSGVQYIKNVHPFLEMFDRPMSRAAVIHWLREHNLPVPVKSACVFCPFHDRAIWREIKLSDNGDWAQALEIDEAIRHKRAGYLCYLTPERVPLAECDFRNEQDHGQLSLWEDTECSGTCFL